MELPYRILLLSASLVVAGCASKARLQSQAVQAFDSGQPQAAVHYRQLLQEQRNPDLNLEIDAAIASLMAGELKDSETELQAAYKKMQYLKQKDAVEQTSSYLTDDRAVAWTGREYEQRMLDCLLALSSLSGDRTDAYAYSLRATENVQNDLQNIEQGDGPPAIKDRLQPNALAMYLHAAVQSENPMHFDTTKRALESIATWTHPASGSVPVIQTGFGTMSEKQQGVLHVVTLRGRVTDWRNESAVATTGALLIADQILSAMSDHDLPPTVAAVRIAAPMLQASRRPGLTMIRTSQGSEIESRMLVDVNAAAWDSYQADRDQQIARAVVRRIIKKGSIYAAKDQFNVAPDSPANALLSLTGVAWEALEKADTRHLTLLPERIEVAQVALPIGLQTVELHQSQQPDVRNQIQVNIQDGKNCFLIVFCPTDRIQRIIGGDLVN